MTQKTKIVATIGPASDSKEILEKMIKAGMDVARINFSHGTHISNGQSINNIKELRKDMGCPIGIMADLQGPRIRILVDNEVKLNAGEIIRVSDSATFPNFQFPISNFQTNPNDPISKIIFLDCLEIVKSIEIGNEILIEDGTMKLKVVKKEKEYLEAEVIAGGIVKNHKGVNLPDTQLNLPILTAKDESDLKFALDQEVDFVALSFVGNGKELEMVRKKMQEILKRETDLPQLVSKIERKEALRNIDEIIQASDVVMVARGDLGIETPESEVTLHQKEIIAKCLQFSKPVIVATQMMDSMIEKPLPTRAEVADVSNAVIDHTDAVMLSGESANGQYPVETIAMMNEIILKTETSPFDDTERSYPQIDKKCIPTLKLIQKSSQKNVAVFSDDGILARMISNCRKEQNLIVGTNNFKVYNQLALVWGVNAYFFAEQDAARVVDLAIEKAQKECKISENEEVLRVA